MSDGYQWQGDVWELDVGDLSNSGWIYGQRYCWHWNIGQVKPDQAGSWTMVAKPN